MEAINIENQKEYIETVKKLNEDKNVKYSILTMGCQLNENDSEKLSGMIEEMGYTRTENIEEADLIVFNTCCVMEAALRSVSEILTGEELEKIEFKEIRGEQGIKRASLKLGERDIKVVVAHGLGNAQTIMEEIKSGKADYQFVEIMACPGGCIMGGGQPIKSSKIRSTVDVRKLRADSLYSIDEASAIRKSHQNPTIINLYN